MPDTAFKVHLTQCMDALEQHSCRGDLGLCVNLETRSSDWFKYYMYILCYVCDVLFHYHDVDNVFNKLNIYVPLKPGAVNSPNINPGTKLKLMQLYNVIWMKSMSPSKYVQVVVRICSKYVRKNFSESYKLPNRADNLFWLGH